MGTDVFVFKGRHIAALMARLAWHGWHGMTYILDTAGGITSARIFVLALRGSVWDVATLNM